jgi:sugar phosphate isomerase/epimerase
VTSILSNVPERRSRPWKIASRLNSFRRPGVEVDLAVRSMAAVPGVSALELNYPQHVVELGVGELDRLLMVTKLPLTALNLRFEGPRFARGAFTSPDQEVRAEAVGIASDAVDLAARLGAAHVVLWMADDGWDYPFQANYGKLWSDEIEGFRIVADRNSSIRVSVEYKPSGPRRFSLIRSMGDALLAVSDVDRANFGVTLDVCHSYMASEHPPAAAAAALRAGKLFGVHLNDGYGTADDGLMLATVHQRDTLELLHVLRTEGYDGTLYFDTFPVREDPAAELEANIAELERLEATLDQMNYDVLREAQMDQDVIAVSRALVGN